MKSLSDLENLHRSQLGGNLFLPTAVGHEYHNRVICVEHSLEWILGQSFHDVEINHLFLAFMFITRH